MVGLTSRINTGYNVNSNGPLQQNHNGVVRKHSNTTSVAARKTSKLSKLDDEHYIEGMSPPRSANESETLPPLSVPTNLQHNHAPHQNFQSRFPPPPSAFAGIMYDHDDEDEEMDGEHEVDDDLVRHHTETETEDEDYNNVYGVHGPTHHQHYAHPYMSHHGAQRSRVSRPKSQKRKRQSTLDSTGSSSSSGFPGSGSRWDELIEAATKRAVVENSPMPLSPPQTAQTLPSICPNTPSGNSTTSSHDLSSPRVQCAECRSLAPVKNSYICTECVSGFCEDCALSAGKRGICGECRVFGAKFKPLKVVIRT